ncbi:hypothetical protein GGH94_005310 [Coemansia aciculifera]|uniref:HCP-like protein n=2 Tax=Coemansia TaxID=4863 RepID=A0A9W8GWS0_9FUNG|nr:hypothetical protein GGI19_003921 [Coemansia pectinata]KAJ2860774.1 hypothetical protein GGH94_005310 [Coemansia aciculifera]KAJ2886198.1 hypothetical protein H4R27_000857 [Coemansia aciculifera]
MSFFRKALSRTRDKPEPAPSPQRFLAAGRQAAEDMNIQQQQQQHSTYGDSGTEHSKWRQLPKTRQQNYYVQHHDGSTTIQRGAFEPEDNGDFDDAASYHSTSSNPGMHRPATAAQNEPSYPQTMPSRYLQMATQGRETARANRPPVDSYYSTLGDDNLFRNAGPMPDGASEFSRAGARLPTTQQPQAKQKTPQELGEEYFQKAVNFHEQGDLVSATGYFKRAADKHNPLGMLFYGLSLRHGWGCQPNENLAFVFLQKAGEQVVPHVKDMDPAVAGMAREELAMAIYELGQSYRHGWGVSRNKKTAAYYFEVSAELGDADSQADLAACYEKGDGVKRDMKKAAHYYRLAHKQGIEMFGTSWIFKKKYESD